MAKPSQGKDSKVLTIDTVQISTVQIIDWPEEQKALGIVYFTGFINNNAFTPVERKELKIDKDVYKAWAETPIKNNVSFYDALTEQCYVWIDEAALS